MSTKTKNSESQNDSENKNIDASQTEIFADMYEEIKKLNTNIKDLQSELIELRSQTTTSNFWLFAITLMVVIFSIASYRVYSSFMDTAYVQWAKELNNLYKDFMK